LAPSVSDPVHAAVLGSAQALGKAMAALRLIVLLASEWPLFGVKPVRSYGPFGVSISANRGESIWGFVDVVAPAKQLSD
jgi:hypothetical protein